MSLPYSGDHTNLSSGASPSALVSALEPAGLQAVEPIPPRPWKGVRMLQPGSKYSALRQDRRVIEEGD